MLEVVCAKEDTERENMGKSFIAMTGAGTGDVLAFVAETVAEGAVATVPAACLPVLAHAASCRPDGNEDFVFRAPSPNVARCGLGERALAVLLLIVFAPLLVLVSLLVLAFDGWPILFRQERFGCNGERFTLLKFRTMKPRSERLHARLQNRLGQEGRLFKLERDPRVTRLGAALRRTFIDKWPQLINVARGEMRFIGPRPLPASDQAHYTRPCHASRLRGMTGMTGLWQVSGRNRLTFDEMCLLDIYYLGNRSLRFDLWLAARTVGVIFEQACLKREPERCGEKPADVEGAGGSGNRDDACPYPAGERRDKCE